MRVALVGATGLVGSVMLKVLAERNFPVDELIPVASANSVGKSIKFKGRKYAVVSVDDALSLKPDLALFSAGGNTSLKLAPRFAEIGAIVIDNSSAWRMDPTKKLIVPEVNAYTLNASDKIIANPNCSTIQMVVVLKPLHDRYKINRVVVSTYQSVAGSGVRGIQQLMNERKNIKGPMIYAHPIDLNAIPHIDVFQDNGYTKEEMKMILETKKIMGDDSIRVTATTVRIPVVGGHSEAVNIEFEDDFDLDEVKHLLEAQEGLIVVDDPANARYPMPMHAHEKDEVFVGRIRRDYSQPKSLNLWIVADPLRKGAATNAVQIAEYMLANGLLH